MKFSNIIFTTPDYNQKPSAWMEHIPFAFFLTEMLRPEIFVELGTHYGNSYFAFCQAIKSLELPTKAFAVDSWKGDDHAGYYGEEVFQYVKQINNQSFSNFSRLLRMSFDKALSSFEEGSIDLLHIDGEHTYEAVKHDFESWLPKMSNKGVIIFHDTNVYDKGFGVWKLIKKIKDKYPFLEFKHGYGLGVLYVGTNKNCTISNFIETANKDEFTHKLFENMGKIIAFKNENNTLIEEVNNYKNTIDVIKTENNNKLKVINEQISDLEQLNKELYNAFEQVKLNLQKYKELLTDKEMEVENLYSNLITTKQNLEEKEIRVNILEKKIELISHSYSWRITAPLRFLKNNRLIKKLVLRQNIKIVKNSGLFNELYYLKHNPDVKKSNMNPMVHFIVYGGFEKRNPSKHFDTSFYIKKYPDVAASGINPLIHFIKYGKSENRKTLPVVRNNSIFQIKLKLLGVNPEKFNGIIDLQANSIKLKQLLGDKFEGTSWPEKGETMIGYKRLTNLEMCLTDIIKNDIPGDLIETGVWKGGACIFMKYILDAYNVQNKKIWVADSFEGVPPPNENQYPHDKEINLYKYKELSISMEEVKNNFKKYGVLDDRVEFVKGWFKDTLPKVPITKLSILRLDGDLYESTIDALINLYPKLSVGGYCIIDDWGAVDACKKAVKDFRKAFEITDTIQRIDWTGVYWKKSKDIVSVSKMKFRQLISKSS